MKVLVLLCGKRDEVGGSIHFKNEFYRNKGYRESAECIELQTKADVHSKDETETVDLIDTEKKNTR